MKVLYQWAKKNPNGWEEIDAKDWASLPKRPVPSKGQLGGLNNVPGWLRNVSVQGITAEGYDHVAIEPITIGLDEGVKYILWNDDHDDAVVDGVEDWINDPQAIVWTIMPLAPDPKLGMAINTRQSCVRYATGERYSRLLAHSPQNTTVRPWTEFTPPADSITRHGVWLEDTKFQEHLDKAPQSKFGWMHWADHLPESETEIVDGVRKLKEQRAQGRYKQAEHTITYYQRDTNTSVSFDTFTHEDSLSTTTAGSATESVTTDSNTVKSWVFTTPTNQPNSADWPNGAYHVQWNVTAASGGLVYGDASTAVYNNTFKQISADTTTGSSSKNGDGNFSGTGLKLETTASDWDPAANLASDRYAVALAARGDSHGDAITLTLNTTDSYADGPWSTTSAAVTGTITPSATEADIVAGGKTIIITLTGDTWVTAGATFDGQRDEILQGLDSAQSESNGWNAQVRDVENVTAVVRTSDTVVTITLNAAASYNITATETIC